MNIFEQLQDQMKQQFNQQGNSYLLPSDLNTVLGFCKSQPDVAKLEGCNVIAVLATGAWLLFSINPEKENPPNRNVKCYSSGNGFHTERDIVEVFNFIQQQSIAWTQI